LILFSGIFYRVLLFYPMNAYFHFYIYLYSQLFTMSLFPCIGERRGSPRKYLKDIVVPTDKTILTKAHTLHFLLQLQKHSSEMQ
jgi:hypothetical protein